MNPERVYPAKNKGEFSYYRFTDEAIHEFVTFDKTSEIVMIYNMRSQRCYKNK